MTRKNSVGEQSRSRAGWRALRRAATLLIAAGALLSPLANVASAARPKEKPEDTEKSYLIPYVLVGLCVAFGVMVVCRPSVREDKEAERPQDASEED